MTNRAIRKGVMHEKLKQAVGVECANCLTCAHLGNEGDGYEYNGTWSVCNKFDRYSYLKPFPFKTEQKCWEPEFWNSKFTKLIDGSDESVSRAIDEFNAARESA
jgi:hypothetical protein